MGSNLQSFSQKPKYLALLGVLKSKYDPTLPSDARTLLETPTSISSIKEISGGKYYHFGLKNVLDCFLSRIDFHSLDMLRKYGCSMRINVDGLSIFTSPKDQFWLILVNCSLRTIQ